MSLIKLDSAELRSQASEMTALGSEYEHLFANVSSILTNVNDNWSPNLANNFSGKITNAQKSFSNVVEMLRFGADAANSSAESFSSIDSVLSKRNQNGQAADNEYAAVKLNGAVQTSKTKGVKKKKRKNYAEEFWDACIGVADATVTKAKKLISKAKKSYEEKGVVYDIVEYGKCTLKVASATVKIVGAVGSIASGVGIPIAICGIISAGNDIVNACNDAAYIYTDQYDKVGTTNLLKDTLVNNMGEFGAMYGYRDAGELAGNIIYTGLDVVSFLNGADKMLKSLGKVNTVVTNSTGYSKVWGETTFSDVLDNKLKFSLEPDYFIRKILKVKPSSDLNIVYEGVKNIYSTIKKSIQLGGNIGNIFS